MVPWYQSILVIAMVTIPPNFVTFKNFFTTEFLNVSTKAKTSECQKGCYRFGWVEKIYLKNGNGSGRLIWQNRQYFWASLFSNSWRRGWFTVRKYYSRFILKKDPMYNQMGLVLYKKFLRIFFCSKSCFTLSLWYKLAKKMRSRS